MKKILLLSFSLFVVGINTQAAPTPAVVTIPDAKFKAALIDTLAGIDKNKDGQIQVTEAAVVKSLDVSADSITDLTGIEAFTALDSLACYNNFLTSLNLSANTSLAYLDCSYDSIASLDLSANTKLNTLYCNNNVLTVLNISTNPKLSFLACSNNSITALNFVADTALTYIDCSYNLVTTIDVTNCKNLNLLNCEYGAFTSLDVSKNAALTTLIADNNLDLLIICINVNQSLLTTSDPTNWQKPANTCDWSTTNCAINPPSTVGIEEYVIPPAPKTLIHIIDLYGREVAPNEIIDGVIYIYQYSDGSVQKIVRL